MRPSLRSVAAPHVAYHWQDARAGLWASCLLGLLKELGMTGASLGTLSQAVVPTEPPAPKPEHE